MTSTKSIKQRIKSVKNTAQITKAMEVVSATKMRKSQEFALRARPYAAAALEMMQNLLSRTPALPPLLWSRPVQKSALLVVTSDKGLAGAFNANVLRKAETLVRERSDLVLVTVGKKARDYFERRGFTIDKSFWGFGDYSAPQETVPVANHILNGFLFGQWDEVNALYTHFRTTLIQETVMRKILPATKEGLEEAVKEILPERGKYADYRGKASIVTIEALPLYKYEYKFEPSAEEILNTLIPHLIRMHIHHIILESNASEHSARMVAMKNASDNASDLITNLTLQFNKARQAGITKELIEVAAGAALEQ